VAVEGGLERAGHGSRTRAGERRWESGSGADAKPKKHSVDVTVPFHVDATVENEMIIKGGLRWIEILR
jgi:hypothetical protein